MTDLGNLIERLGSYVDGNTIFECSSIIGSRLAEHGRSDYVALELTIRLLDARYKGRISEENTCIVDLIADSLGLFPYISRGADQIGIRRLITESHCVDRQSNFVLHSEQMRIYLALLNGDNVILSARTSFGKSAILDFFVIRKKPKTVIVIVPTIALIDETRRRLLKRLPSYYQILFHKDDIRISKFAVYVMTQERLLDRSDIKNIDFLFIDEFYKLDPSRDDERYQYLNIAAYKFGRIAKQIFMAGPHIKGIDFGTKWNGKFQFVQTDYRTVSVDIIDQSNTEDRQATFLADYQTNIENLGIIFTASPPSARDLANVLIKADSSAGSNEAIQTAKWLAENYSPHWNLVSSLQMGIGLHHGKIPRAIAQKMISLFELSKLRTLICTSTLIEGVNTSAAIIYVYDKKINTTDFDFFSFSNIRGRAGRMMKHFIGKVYLYHKPPAQSDLIVDAPIYSDPSNAAASIIFSVEDSDITGIGVQRRENIAIESGLSRMVIQRFGSIGIENLKNLSAELDETLKSSPEKILWSGLPSKLQRDFLFDALFRHIIKPNRYRIGARSGSQLSFYLDQLRRIKTIRKFFSWLEKSTTSDDLQETVEIGFEFLRGCDFTVPTVIVAAETIVNEILQDEPKVNWSFYASSIENYFRPKWVKALDERGIPFALGEKFRDRIPEGAEISDALIFFENVRDGIEEADVGSSEYKFLANFA